jgi:hypothetical protein
MSANERRRTWGALGAAGIAVLVAACGGGSSSTATPSCDGACQDAVALHAIRDAIKLAYNLGLQGQPVGPQDAGAPCPLGGSAQVTGTATSNASVGSTTVALSYVFTACSFSETDTDPKQNYSVVLGGTFKEVGTIAQQPSTTTALTIDSTSFSLKGTVYSPGISYSADGCALQTGQNGNQLSGTMCGRSVGLTL